MINYLAKKMIHNYNELEDPAVRKAYGNLTSTVGIANNVILFLFKFLAGTLARSCLLYTSIDKFAGFLRTFVDLKIPHIQFNVVRKEDLLAAQKHPEQYASLTVRVAGYTAYFVELAQELQNEIIARTSYEGI